MGSEQTHAGSVTRSTREHNGLLAVEIDASVLEQLIELLARTDFEVLLGSGEGVEGHAHTSGHMAASKTRARLGLRSIEARLRTGINDSHVNLSLLVGVDQIHHLVEDVHGGVVRLDAEGARLSGSGRFASLHRTLFSLPARETSVQNVHLHVLVEHLEHPPGAGGAEQTVSVVEHNLVGVVQTDLFHALLEVRSGRKHVREIQLTIGDVVDVEELGSRNVLLMHKMV